MIQANELRIGNFVKTPNQDFFRIDAFEYLRDDFGKVAQGKDTQYHPLPWYLNNIEPIPLTPEILEKCGLTNTIYLNGYAYNFDITGDVSFNHGEYEQICNVKYLHQLQNLYFALTGEELSVNL